MQLIQGQFIYKTLMNLNRTAHIHKPQLPSFFTALAHIFSFSPTALHLVHFLCCLFFFLNSNFFLATFFKLAEFLVIEL